MVKLKKIDTFFWLMGRVQSLEMALRGVKASFTAIVSLPGLACNFSLM